MLPWAARDALEGVKTAGGSYICAVWTLEMDNVQKVDPLFFL
jgi:hypothetical protein